MITEFILFTITITSVILAAAIGMYFRKKNLRFIAEIAQLSIDKQILVDQLAQEVIKNQAIHNTDGFLKFVSDSRDWAFQYIEEVQVVIQEIANKNTVSHLDIERLKALLPKNVDNN